jgi:hypothetical protein
MKKIVSLILFSSLFLQTSFADEQDPYINFIEDKVLAGDQFDKVAKFYIENNLVEDLDIDPQEILAEAKAQLELSKGKIVKTAKKID